MKIKCTDNLLQVSQGIISQLVVISYLYIVSTSGAFAPQFSMQISANLKASRGKPKFLAPLNSVI